MVVLQHRILEQLSWHSKGLKPEQVQREDVDPQIWGCREHLGPLSMAGGGSEDVLACRRCALVEGLLPGEGAVGGDEQTVKHEGR